MDIVARRGSCDHLQKRGTEVRQPGDGELTCISPCTVACEEVRGSASSRSRHTLSASRDPAKIDLDTDGDVARSHSDPDAPGEGFSTNATFMCQDTTRLVASGSHDKRHRKIAPMRKGQHLSFQAYAVKG